ncbi:MAG: SlyX family protein [Pseudomonadota bacterium]
MSASDDQNNNDRLEQLESKLAFLEHTVDVLSGELEAQQNETGSLHKKLNELQEQIESLQRDTGIGDGHDEIPPHY